MAPAVLPVQESSPAGILVLALLLPVVGILLTFLSGAGLARPITLVLLTAGLGVSAAIVVGVWRNGNSLTYVSGGWAPPLGIKLRADGLSAAMLAVTALVIFAVALYASPKPGRTGGRLGTRASFSFWILLLAVWAAMNAVFLGNDLFNLYVALELATFAAVPLVSLSGSAGTLAA
ncbi:MAG TPA: hypothetical protein VMS23_05670, partial [Terrimicrobiaceae bacterium]|nr:hypothetical protein [Terrimicrobiaceae bacterium]